MSNPFRLFAVLAALCAAAGTAAADEIVLGQVAALAGPTRALGQGMRLGLITAFDEVNRKGGVLGRKLVLVTRDDSYEPTLTETATNRLIQEDHVLALIGAVGTPTSEVAVPIAVEAKVPYIGAFTGASFLRDPKLKYVVNVRASYDQEAEMLVAALTEHLRRNRIALFFQNDLFGNDGRRAMVAAFAKRQRSLVAEATYERNSVEVGAAATAIAAAHPDAVVMVCAYAPCAALVKRLHDDKIQFATISFAGAEAYAKAAGVAGEGTIISQVVPLPSDLSSPLIQEFRAALKADGYVQEPDLPAVEGYLDGRVMVAALERAGAEPTRENLLAAIYGLGHFELGGLSLNYGPGNNHGSDFVHLTVVGQGGRLEPFNPPTR